MWMPLVRSIAGIASVVTVLTSRDRDTSKPPSVDSLFEPGQCGVGSNPHNHFANSGIQMMYSKYRDWRSLNVELKRSALWMEQNVKSIGYSNVGGYMSPLFNTTLTDSANSSAVKVIQDIVVNAIQDFVDKKQCETTTSPRYEAIVQNAWFNVIRKGNYNALHVHGGRTKDIQRMVAVYYVEAGDSDSSPMVLASPWHRWKRDDHHELCTTGNDRFCTSDGLIIKATVASGTLLLFPGTLYHAVLASTSERARISLAWNIELKAVASTSMLDSSPPCVALRRTPSIFQTCEIFPLRELGPNFLGTSGGSELAKHVRGTAFPVELFGKDSHGRSLPRVFRNGSDVPNVRLSGIAITTSGKTPQASCTLPGLKHLWHFEHYKHHFSAVAPFMEQFGAVREPVLLPNSVVLLPGFSDLQQSGQLESLKDAANASSCSVLLFAIQLHADSAALAPALLLNASYDDALYFLNQMNASSNDQALMSFMTRFKQLA
eukprot:TRINITY_DN5571_c0_g1_i2.p1 TRINITY_DN5571_c0_g1~~TRINITY_DN5571_c0_g1_i2.p1  ORF type:complete len:489 (-),score=45.85 TRINITY_DN5571_c0_g1_i2:315-1781(-)